MPSDPAVTSAPDSRFSAPAPEAVQPAPAVQLAQACRALWIATLSLMTAFMQQPAPAHRYLLARRIGRNLETLAGQDCFDAPCRARFARLARRWHERAEPLAPGARAPRPGLLRFLA